MATVKLGADEGKFANLKEEVAVYDSSGKFLGLFSPLNEEDFYQPFTEGELQLAEQQMREGKVHTTAEVLACLKNLESA